MILELVGDPKESLLHCPERKVRKKGHRDAGELALALLHLPVQRMLEMIGTRKG